MVGILYAYANHLFINLLNRSSKTGVDRGKFLVNGFEEMQDVLFVSPCLDGCLMPLSSYLRH